MDEFDIVLPKLDTHKLYRGGFIYYTGDRAYAEESFEVFQDNRGLGHLFKAKLFGRVSSGEILALELNYRFAKDWIPQEVTISKRLGRNNIVEHYLHDGKTNHVIYTFAKDDRQSSCQVPTPPRFYINTPFACTAFQFFLSKHFRSTMKNIYSVIRSNNDWEYAHQPETKIIALEKMRTQVAVNIEDNTIFAEHFRLYEDIDKETAQSLTQGEQLPYVDMYISKYLAIPYLIKSDHENLKIQIKYLNDLEEV
ncbi:MAG: hypothetical protein ISR65_01970 [Bacteriovoracaceae bacterium]|nr:hypothetical protein [Bacteriovoracaceae bacterium]